MADEDLVLRASIKDDLTRPLDKVKDKVDDVTDATNRLARANGSTARAADMAESRLTKLARGGLSRVQDVARTATRYVAYGTTALIGAGVAAAGWGVKVAASMQTARIAFSTMLGSGKKADAFLKDLSAFAAKTPFEFPELQTAASSLLSAGVNADKIIPIMTTLGDVTSGMGTGSEGVRRATVALQQMIAAQRITGEDLNQLRDAGIPVYDLLAKATGKSKAEVVGLAQAGKLGSKELGQMMKALETGKGLERFTGLMDKQSDSLTGVASTFKDTLGMGLAKALQPAVPVLTKLTLGASNLVGKGVGPLADGIAWLIDKGTELHKSGALKQWATETKAEVLGFYDSVSPLVGELLEMGRDALPTVGTGLKVVVGFIKTGAQVLEPFVAGFNELPGATKNVLLLGAALYLLSGKFQNLETRAWGAAAKISEVDKKALGMRAGIGIAGGALMVLGSQLGDSHKGLSDLLTVGGAIATGFAVGGPLGAAVAGIGGVIGIFAGQSQKAADAQKALDTAGRAVADTLDKQTGALGRNTEAVAAKQLADTGAFTAGSKLGLSHETVLRAALGQADAQAKVAAATNKSIDAAKAFAQEHGNVMGPTQRKAVENAKLLAGATGATATAIDKERRSIDQAGAALEAINGKTARVYVKVEDEQAKRDLAALNKAIKSASTAVFNVLGGGGSGDTATRHGRGGSGQGRLASTLGAHSAISGRLGGGYSVSNALVGGGGHGRGSGDHQAGRAVDVVGRNLPAYAREVRASGGYARIHGEGGRKHVHAVMGDTATPHRGNMSASGGGTQVHVHEGAIQINGSGLSQAELQAAVEAALDAIIRENEETAA